MLWSLPGCARSAGMPTGGPGNRGTDPAADQALDSMPARNQRGHPRPANRNRFRT
jgi:hypothetical protein